MLNAKKLAEIICGNEASGFNPERTSQDHVSRGGTFKASKRTRMEVIEIEEIIEGVHKKQLYNEYLDESDVPEKRICGV